MSRLVQMSTADLRTLYREMFSSDVQGGNPEFARRRIAWRVQAEQEGGLPESARQHALAIAREIPARLRLSENVKRQQRGVPLERTVSVHVISDHDSRLPMPGSLIVKAYKGRNLSVRVLTSGFEYEGKKFTSLSAIAREITRTRWNGFSFFGLTKE
jgi:hypothetical protein